LISCGNQAKNADWLPVEWPGLPTGPLLKAAVVLQLPQLGVAANEMAYRNDPSFQSLLDERAELAISALFDLQPAKI
jgi:hypothetical protein